MTAPSIALIIPAYNEALTIATVIETFHRIRPDLYIVVIDNRSEDRTKIIAEETLTSIEARGVVLSESKRGKSNAIALAFSTIRADYYVMVDADDTYPAHDLPPLLHAAIDNHIDLVVGNRMANGRYELENQRPFHVFGNHLVRRLVNLLFRSRLHDIMSGYRVMSRRFVEAFPIRTTGFELETEMTLFAIQHGFSISEIPITYSDRPAGTHSKLSTFKDGFHILTLIMTTFFRRMISRPQLTNDRHSINAITTTTADKKLTREE